MTQNINMPYLTGVAKDRKSLSQNFIEAAENLRLMEEVMRKTHKEFGESLRRTFTKEDLVGKSYIYAKVGYDDFKFNVNKISESSFFCKDKKILPYYDFLDLMDIEALMDFLKSYNYEIDDLSFFEGTNYLLVSSLDVDMVDEPLNAKGYPSHMHCFYVVKM